MRARFYRSGRNIHPIYISFRTLVGIQKDFLEVMSNPRRHSPEPLCALCRQRKQQSSMDIKRTPVLPLLFPDPNHDTRTPLHLIQESLLKLIVFEQTEDATDVNCYCAHDGGDQDGEIGEERREIAVNVGPGKGDVERIAYFGVEFPELLAKGAFRGIEVVPDRHSHLQRSRFSMVSLPRGYNLLKAIIGGRL